MTTIPTNTKVELKKSDSQFNKDPMSMKVINAGILGLAKKAVGNVTGDNEPYTIRINFQNGRIVGGEAQPRLSVELLNGRATTSSVELLSANTDIFFEYTALVMEGFDPITNNGSWVARARLDGDTVKNVFVNHDFSEEDRELIKAAMLRGFLPQIQG